MRPKVSMLLALAAMASEAAPPIPNHRPYRGLKVPQTFTHADAERQTKAQAKRDRKAKRRAQEVKP